MHIYFSFLKIRMDIHIQPEINFVVYITCSFLIPSGGGGRLGGGCFSRLILTGLTGHSSSEGGLSDRILFGVGGRGLSGYSDVSINKNQPLTKFWYNMLHISFMITHLVTKSKCFSAILPYLLYSTSFNKTNWSN